jgi:hypothetical protein
MGPRAPVADMRRPNTSVRPELPSWVHRTMESPAKSFATTSWKVLSTMDALCV